MQRLHPSARLARVLLTSVAVACPLAAQSTPGSFTLIGVGCEGSGGVPRLEPTRGGDVPLVGMPFSITVSNLPWFNDPMFMLIGFTPMPPILLDAIGMEGCFLLVKDDIVVPLARDPFSKGELAELTLDVPNLPNAIGAHFYTQALLVDQPLFKDGFFGWPNDLGLTTSNGGDGVVGGAGAGMAPTVTVRGRVFYDIDEDGVFNPAVPNELPIEGWKVRLSNGSLSEIFTEADGTFEFVFPQDSMPYTLTSLPPPPGFIGGPGGRWVPTTSISESFTTDGVTDVVHDFGAFFLQNDTTIVRSPDFYTTMAGEAELAACGPGWRAGINEACLRTNFSNPNGEAGTLLLLGSMDPFAIAYQSYKSYLQLPPNDVLAFVLSRLVGATVANVSCGPAAGSTIYIDRAGDDVLIPFDEIYANTRALLCDPRSADTGPLGDPGWRAVIQQCLNEWDGITSDGDGVFRKADQANDWKSSYKSPY